MIRKTLSFINQYIQQNWDRFNLSQYSAKSRICSLILTPTFQTSGHLIFLVFLGNQKTPSLVVKTPRDFRNVAGLKVEASNLEKLGCFDGNIFRAIPRLISFENYSGIPLLVETALPGKKMNHSYIKKYKKKSIEIILNWLIEFHKITKNNNSNKGTDNLFKRSYKILESNFSYDEDISKLLHGTREYSDLLKKEQLVSVFEHGDLSNPNILILKNKHLGIVDWELSNPTGLPFVDFVFFLNFVAYAQVKSKNEFALIRAFDEAFFGNEAWAIPYINIYSRELSLNPKLLKPLFISHWCHYFANVFDRLKYKLAVSKSHPYSTNNCSTFTRYYSLWRHTILNQNKIMF